MSSLKPLQIDIVSEVVCPWCYIGKRRMENALALAPDVQVAADCGLDPNEVRRRLASDEDVALISAQAKEASDNGISGVPTFVFAQKYAVSGAQPAEQLARAIRQVSAEVNAQAAE